MSEPELILLTGATGYVGGRLLPLLVRQGFRVRCLAHKPQYLRQILCTSGVPVIELRASIILGSGSLSFEMIRALVERLPVMVTPKWVNVPAQPIAIEDVLAYLLEALRYPTHVSRTFEIGGSDAVSYGDV